MKAQGLLREFRVWAEVPEGAIEKVEKKMHFQKPEGVCLKKDTESKQTLIELVVKVTCTNDELAKKTESKTMNEKVRRAFYSIVAQKLGDPGRAIITGHLKSIIGERPLSFIYKYEGTITSPDERLPYKDD